MAPRKARATRHGATIPKTAQEQPLRDCPPLLATSSNPYRLKLSEEKTTFRAAGVRSRNLFAYDSHMYFHAFLKECGTNKITTKPFHSQRCSFMAPNISTQRMQNPKSTSRIAVSGRAVSTTKRGAGTSSVSATTATPTTPAVSAWVTRPTQRAKASSRRCKRETNLPVVFGWSRDDLRSTQQSTPKKKKKTVLGLNDAT